MKGSAHGTGDPNFAAAAMAVGIPLDERQVIAVKRDNGRDYVRWFLGPVSIDGRVSLAAVNRAWSERANVSGNPDLEGFSWVMEFISKRDINVRSSSDWMAWAHDHLREMGEPGRFPTRLEDAAGFVDRHPHDRAGHVFAFLLNRDLCLHLAKQAAEDPRLMFASGHDAFGMLRERAPKWRKDQFLKMIG